MACQQCGRTMQNVGLADADRRVWWCPSCGSILTATVERSEFEPPKIIAQALAVLSVPGFPRTQDDAVAVRALREAATGRAEA